MKQKLWSDKIPYISRSKAFFSGMNYRDINLWPIMASEVYTHYVNENVFGAERGFMFLKFLFTMDKFKIEGEKGRIFSSFVMPRDDHHTLVKKSFEKFSKDELTILDACEYKKSRSLLKFSYHFPDIPLFLKIWKRFRKYKMHEVFGEKYLFFIARTYFRYKQIDLMYDIYEKYKPRAYVAFCSQAFAEDGIMTLICKKNKIPTFTLQHGLIVEYPKFNAASVLNENVISDYNLLWGKSTLDIMKKYVNSDKLVVVGNPKYDNFPVVKKEKGDKYGIFFFPVIGYNESQRNLLEILIDFAKKHPDFIIYISLHPFDDVNNYIPKVEKLKNVKFLKGEEFKELIPNSRFFVLHNTTLAMEFLQYDIPIFRFDDKYFVDLWDYPDKFKNFQGLDKLFDKFCERKKKSGGKSFYRVEFLRHFHISKKGTSQNYYDKISSLTSQFYNNKV